MSDYSDLVKSVLAASKVEVKDSVQFWPAPAKLNLYLNITGRREDGYHNLQTVFQFLDVADRLRFEVRDDKKIQRKTDNEGVKAEDDLVVKAAIALQKASATEKGADIYLQKLLPMGGGVGGGSSDAATTLIALNQLWQTGLDMDALKEIGLSLGADVPIFIHGHAAFAEGVGEQLTTVEPHEPIYLVVKPEINISTAEIFNDQQLTRDCPAIRICDLQIGTENEAPTLEKLGNVFEPVVARHYPEIAEVIQLLNRHTKQYAKPGQYSKARLTGTGACVYATFESEEDAEQVMAQLPDNCDAFIARGLNQSPLQAMLDSVEE